jgi:tetrahydromethanopterin S-methyltransferase subunit E
MGMLVTLIGAEQIIGLLAARVLTTATTVTTMGVLSSTSQVLQPLDILIVQANTNTLLSHFVSLVCTLYLTFSVHQLDPPSTDED